MAIAITGVKYASNNLGIFRSLLMMFVILSGQFSLAIGNSPVTLDWQPEPVYSKDKTREIRTRFKATPITSRVGSKANSITSEYNGKVHITGKPFQRLIACAGLVASEDAGIIATEIVNTVLLQSNKATLNITNSKPCPESLLEPTEARYNWQDFLYSDSPFLVRTPEKKSQETGFPSSSTSKQQEAGFFLSFLSAWGATPESVNLLSAQGYGMDNDDHSFRRPPFMPMPGKADFNLLLLPVLRLPSDWATVLSGERLSHWLWGQPDYDSGITLLLRFDHHPAIRISVSHAEFQELAGQLASSRQLLHWLAPKLNGREAFIQQLLWLQTTYDESSTPDHDILDSDTREAIEKQLAIVLEQPDTEFSLEFETLTLATTLSSSIAIIEANGDKKTKQTGQVEDKGQESKESDSKGATGKQPDSSGDKTEEQAGDDNMPPEDSESPSRSKKAAVAPDCYELNVNGENFLIRAENVDRKFLVEKNIKDIKAYSPQGIRGKHEVRLSKIEDRCAIPQSYRLSRDAKALDFFLLYGTEEAVRKLHRRHLRQGFDLPGKELPEAEIEKASNTILAAIHHRAPAVQAMATRNHDPLSDAIERNLPACVERLLEEGHQPAREEAKAKLIRLAVISRNIETTGTGPTSTAVLEILLSYWPDAINVSLSDGTTALHSAIQQGDVEVFEQLINRVDDTEVPDLKRELLAYIPVELGSQKREGILRLLAITDPDSDANFNRFIKAVKEKKPGAAKNFVKNGVDLTIKWENKTALQMAVESGDSEMVSSLLAYVNDSLNAEEAQAGEPAVIDVSEGSKGYEILNSQTHVGGPLHIAIMLDQPTLEAFDNVTKIIQELMSKKANINLKRKSDGATPLFLAAQSGNFKVVNLLLEKKEILDLDGCRESDQATPFFIAVENSHIKVVRQLISNGADISLPKTLPGEGRVEFPLLTAYKNSQNQVKDSPEIFNLLVRMSDGVLDQLGTYSADPSHSSPEYRKAVRLYTAFEDLVVYDRAALERSAGDKSVKSVLQKRVSVVGRLHGAPQMPEPVEEPELEHETSGRYSPYETLSEVEMEPEPVVKKEMSPQSPSVSVQDFPPRRGRSLWRALCPFSSCGSSGDDEPEVKPLLDK